MMLMTAMMGMITEQSFNEGNPRQKTHSILDNDEPKPIKKVKLKGIRFVIHGEEIYAMNEKNARRKYDQKYGTKK